MEGQRGRSGSGIYSSLAGALATAQLRRLQLGWAVSAVGGWVFFVALSVYAFDVGGAAAVGAAALTRMVPAGLAAPLAGVLADRHSRRDVLLGSIALRALVLGAIGGAVAAAAPLALVLTLAAVPDFRASAEGIRPIEDAVHGFRQVLADRRLRMVVGALAFSTTVEGAIDVLVVLVAIDLLGLGGAGVGWLNACWGFGGVIGGAAALTLLRRGRLTAGLSAGGLLVGIPLMLIALAESTVAAVAMLILLGIGYALIEVAGLSLLQRLPSNDLLGRAFAVVESSYWITTGLGAILAPLLVHLVGLRDALLVVGACLPLLVAFRWRPLAMLEEGIRVPERPFKLLRAVEMFAPLPLATIENVSRRVDAVHVHAGETVVREGDSGDRFFLVAEGRLDVSCERGAYPPVGAGDVFGEIALLQDVPRTATVTARDECLLYVLDRESFLCAVSSHASAAGAARRVVSERLARVPFG